MRFSGVSILNCPDFMLLLTATRYRESRFRSEKVLSLFLDILEAILVYLHAFMMRRFLISGLTSLITHKSFKCFV